MPCFQQEYAFVYFLRTMLVSTFGVKTSQIFYEQMLCSIFRAPMSFFFLIQLHQEGIHTTVDPVSKLGFIQRKSCKRRKEDKMYYTAMCKGHINEPNIKEDKCYCTCGLNCQKNTSATQDQCNGHSLSEKYNCSLAGSNSANTPSHL